MADYYVDLSAANDGDGTAYNQAASGGATGAYNTLASKTFSSGDKVWCRRVTRGSNYSSDVTFSNAGVLYIGWPISGDAHYSTRPSGAQATWDADGGTHCGIPFTGAGINLVVSGNNIELHRMYVLVANAIAPIEYSTNTGVKHYNCKFECTATMTIVFTANSSSNTSFVYEGCEFKATTWNGGSSVYFLSLVGANAVVANCTVAITSSTPGAGNAFLMNLGSTGALISNFAATVGTIAGSQGLGGLIILAANNFVNGWTATVTTHTASVSQNTISIGSVGNYNTVKNFQCNFGNGISFGSGDVNTLEVTSFTQRHAVTAGSVLFASGGHGNKLFLSNATFVSGNTTGDVVFASGCINCDVYCRNVLFAGTPATLSSVDFTRMLSFDHNQSAGDFKAYYPDGTIEASNTYRSGGESFSYKLTNTNSSAVSKGAFPLSQLGAETIWLSLATGSVTVTLYGAYKGYTPLSAHDVWAELEYLNGSGLIVNATTYVYNGDLTSDSSTWNNDTGLTVFKLVLTLTLPSDQVCPLRIYGVKYAASSYLYIDPKPVVT
jgi:hypothetical protein